MKVRHKVHYKTPRHPLPQPGRASLCGEGRGRGRAGPEYRWWKDGGAEGPWEEAPLLGQGKREGEMTPLSEGAGCSGNQSARSRVGSEVR